MQFVLRGNYCIEEFYKMILYPDSYLWFLWVLFWINVSFTGAQYVADKFKIDELSIILTTCILLLVVMVLFEFRMLGFQFLAYYFLFYTFGYCVHRFKKLQTSSFYVLILLTALWLCLAWVWTMHGLPSWMPVIPYVPQTLLQYAYRSFTAIVAIYVLLNVSPLALSGINKFNTWISKVGILSLGMYVSHCTLAGIFIYIIISHWIKLPVFFNIVVTSIISFVVAWVTVNLLAKNKYTAKYFLGKL
ncbi:MAG: hypothetical protein EOM50_04125 [Erysipelotrichia bacterium]|nr:hypothetical protein [Erysipelotrichia bacterium]